MSPVQTASNIPTRRLLMISMAFVALYTLCNQLTGLRIDVGQGFFEWERSIPFIAWTVIPYLSIFAFFALAFFVGTRASLDRFVQQLRLNLILSLGCYVLFPLRFQFERPVVDGLLGTLFELLTLCDLPYNRAPSLHISVLLLLWLRLAPCVSGSARIALHAWFAMIGLSVLTTYQHHVIDVPAGLAVGALCVALTSERAAEFARRVCRLRTA